MANRSPEVAAVRFSNHPQHVIRSPPPSAARVPTRQMVVACVRVQNGDSRPVMMPTASMSWCQEVQAREILDTRVGARSAAGPIRATAPTHPPPVVRPSQSGNLTTPMRLLADGVRCVAEILERILSRQSPSAAQSSESLPAAQMSSAQASHSQPSISVSIHPDVCSGAARSSRG